MARTARGNERPLVLLLLPGLIATGCNTPGKWGQITGERAADAIAAAQEAALGRTEPFTIERPKDTLRRRLMLDQYLSHTSPASLGTKDLVPIDQWPQDDYLERDVPQMPPQPWSGAAPLRLSIGDALGVGAGNSRAYQFAKELVYEAALRLDLEQDFFRDTWLGILSSGLSTDLSSGDPVSGNENSGLLEFFKRFENGLELSTRLVVDLVKLLSMDRESAYGLSFDGTIAVPLLRGSGEFVVSEPLRQAERDVIYAIYAFEQFKRAFAVQVVTDYYEVLRQQDEVLNAEENYRALIKATRNATRMAQAGRLPEIQVDQAKQDELAARDLWVAARQEYERQLDAFKESLGLPTDAVVELDGAELERLSAALGATLGLNSENHARRRPGADRQNDHEQQNQNHQNHQNHQNNGAVELMYPSREGGGALEIDPAVAVDLALLHRPDLRVAVGRIFDAQRKVAVGADALRADLTLLGRASFGDRRTLSTVDLGDANLRPERGVYAGLLSLDLPLERDLERIEYRATLIDLERAVRGAQELEDLVKLQVRDDLRILIEARESMVINYESVALAERRVNSTVLFLQAGRAEIRDILEAQEDLLDSKNLLTAATVRYRVAELALQRDMGLLEVNETGLFAEWQPGRPSGGNGASGAVPTPEPAVAPGAVAAPGEPADAPAEPLAAPEAEPAAVEGGASFKTSMGRAALRLWQRAIEEARARRDAEPGGDGARAPAIAEPPAPVPVGVALPRQLRQWPCRSRKAPTKRVR